MISAETLKTLRKYWYVFAVLAVVIAGIAWLVHHFELNPKEVLREYKDYAYYIILVWTFLEGETIVIIAGFLAKSYHLNPWLIALCAFCGSFASDQVMFSLGKYKGQAVLARFPKLGRNLDKAATLFKKYDTILILGFRFVYGVRNVTPIMLGISGVSHKKFFALNFIGAAVWALTFTFGGVYVGGTFELIMGHVGHGILYVIVAVLAVAGLVWYWRSRRAVRHGHAVSRDEYSVPMRADLDDPENPEAAPGIDSGPDGPKTPQG